jgi:ribose transport system substrate-binding protein
MKTRLIAAAVACSLTLVVAGCSTQSGTAASGSKASTKLGYSQPATDPYQNAEQKGVIEQYKKLGYGYLPATNAGGNAGQQLTDVETLVNQGVKGIVMSVLDAKAIVPAIQYANDHKVPIVAIDEAPAGGKVAMIVRADNVKLGELACEQMGKDVKSGQSVVTLDGDPTSSNGRDRTNGFNDCMAKKFPDITLHHIATDWDPAKAATGLQTAFNQYSNIGGVYVQSDTTFYPTVIDTMKKAGKYTKVGSSGHVAIVSVDGGPAAMSAIRSGYQDAAVAQPLLDYIKYGVQYVTKSIDGKTFSQGKTDHDSTISKYEGNLVDLLPTPVVTKSNVDSKALWGNQEFAKEAFASGN